MKQEYTDIITSSLEDVMHDCFMPYAEHVILERALPRVEDGLKPVQRRILYSMYEMNLKPDAKHKKSARIVGDCMGKYHPHGDSSIYDALARMSQDFSMSIPLIDGQGNFGSIDGDSPAAMRYTEARLAPLAMEMLRDIEKETVPFTLNFDDTLQEPVLLPSRYPNLLVNGATGIAVGLATNIPPHNLGEVIDGTVLRMQKPECSLSDVMKYIKAPDFPTGGVLHGLDELGTAYATGRGKITLRAKTHIEPQKNGKNLIVVTELPYEVRESAMLKKIHQLKETKKDLFSGIDSVRSETDRTGIRAVIELKKGVDTQTMLNLLYKYSDLQISYGINMVAIADGQPRQMGILEILDKYITHQRRVVTARVKYDIEQAQEREHKLAGLIIAVENIDLVIKIIRSSANTKEAKSRLMEELALTGVQAQAILDMRLARLTQLEIDELRKEYAEVLALLEYLTGLLASREKLDGVIMDELKDIKKKHSVKRRTEISKETAEIVIDAEQFRVVEDCAVILTKDERIKRMSIKALTKGAEAGEPDERNMPKFTIETNTDGRIQLYTDRGNLYTIYAASIKEAKYKDAGSLLNSLIAGYEKGERILLAKAAGAGKLLTVSREGLIKLTDFADLDTRKTKISACGLKEGDSLILAEPLSEDKHILLITKKGMSIRFDKSEISVQGRSAKGIGAIKLAPGDEVIFAAQTKEDEGYVAVFSNNGFAKQTRLSEYEVQGRNGKGLKTFMWAKGGANGTHLAAAFYITKPERFRLRTDSGVHKTISSGDIPTDARYQKGSVMIMAVLGDELTQVEML